MDRLTINKIPSFLRPREKLLQEGAKSLSTDELLAIILGSGRVGEDAVSLARRILLKAGGLKNLKNWSPEKLLEVEGIGPAKASQILASLALIARFQVENLDFRTPIRKIEDIAPLFQDQLRGREREVFMVAFLDASHHLIGIEELFEGGLNYATISPRVVVTRALDRRAVAVIVAHNHPSGEIKPSQEDISLTQRLSKALELVEIRLLDHLLIVDNQFLRLL